MTGSAAGVCELLEHRSDIGVNKPSVYDSVQYNKYVPSIYSYEI